MDGKQQKSRNNFPKGTDWILFFDIVDRDETKYQIRSPYALTSAILFSDERYNDYFLLHSKVTVQSSENFQQIVHGTEGSSFQQPNSIGYCISANAQMSKCFADLLSEGIFGLRLTFYKAEFFMGQLFSIWSSTEMYYIFNLVTKEMFWIKSDLSTLSRTIKTMKIPSSTFGITTYAILKPGCGRDQMDCQEIVNILRAILAYADVQFVVYTLEETGVHAIVRRKRRWIPRRWWGMR